MTCIGSKAKFAFILGSFSGEMRAAEVWVGGKNVTPFDSSAYVPGLLSALTRSERTLKEELNFLRYEALFFGLSVEEAFLKLSQAGSPELEQAWSHLRFADWGPTTDDFLCFLIPVQSKLYLACQDQTSQAIHSVQVVPYELIQVLEVARHELCRHAPSA
jgi:hypothetical protein